MANKLKRNVLSVMIRVLRVFTLILLGFFYAAKSLQALQSLENPNARRENTRQMWGFWSVIDWSINNPNAGMRVTLPL
ncbi:hypothetical protein NBRC116597_05630 [Phaeobacter sp. NW0010-22]